MDTIAVLANPEAGRGRHRGLLPAVVDRLGRTATVRILTATSGAQAEQACRQAVREGVTALVAVGGDGTVHRALQAVAGTKTLFGVVPAGTGNDFAAAAGAGSLDQLAAAWAERRHAALDVGHITDSHGNERWFAAVLATGFDAIVNEFANRMRFPRGPRRYDVAVVLELARLRPRPYTLVLDGVDHSCRAVLVAIGNGPRYGGGLRICPGADLTDGLLDVVVAAPLGRVALMRIKPRLRHGTHLTDPRVRAHRAREVRIQAPDIVAYADGERIGPLELTVRCEPGAVRLLR
ncbi:diacylglycerol/lipid kinase family protein [Symbioplanes lichenis]|uniref:diacylglycerol/lipid kinase family protein n=1 Tax=Symbioplanes lichenis TaxID=1629072 RepID=UPI002739C733|nr:diacylglycerol kinase family protein [Actinoplanes lichenis]